MTSREEEEKPSQKGMRVSKNQHFITRIRGGLPGDWHTQPCPHALLECWGHSRSHGWWRSSVRHGQNFLCRPRHCRGFP